MMTILWLAQAASASPGCGLAPPVTLGATTKMTIAVDGVQHTYLLHVPEAYKPLTRMPLILSHGGWGVEPLADERYSGLSAAAETYGFIVAYPRGSDDNDHRSPYSWVSFNTIGSVSSTPQHATCFNGSSRYCYASCAARPQGCDEQGCDWTTCFDSITADEAVLDDLEARLCVDTTRVFATGQSNGAMFAMRLAISLAPRISAVVAVSGSFTYGFVNRPKVPVPLFMVTGLTDTTIPVNATDGDAAVADNGWLYATADQVFKKWHVANECGDANESHFPTPFDGVDDLYCWGMARGCAAPVVRCTWAGGHQYYGEDPDLNGPLVWSFFAQVNKPTARTARFDPAALLSFNKPHHVVSSRL